VILLALSLSRDRTKAISYMNGAEDNIKNSTLGEVEPMSQYLLATSKNYSKLYFSGEDKLNMRYYDAIGYFVREAGISTTLIRSNTKEKPKRGFPFFYIKNNNSDGIAVGQIIKGREVISGKSFASQTILLLKN